MECYCCGPIALDFWLIPTMTMLLCHCLMAVKNYSVGRVGVTRGDSLSMMLYAVAVLPLICFLKTPGKWTQNWYADDSSRVAKIFAFFANLVCGTFAQRFR